MLYQIPVLKKCADVRYSRFIIIVSAWGPFVFANHYTFLCFGGKAITVATLYFGTWLWDTDASQGAGNEKKAHAQGHFGLLWFPYAAALGWKKHEVFPLGHPHMPLHKGLKIRYVMPHTAQIARRLYSHATDGKKLFHQSGSLCLAKVMLPLLAPAVQSITVCSHWLKEKK